MMAFRIFLWYNERGDRRTARSAVSPLPEGKSGERYKKEAKAVLPDKPLLREKLLKWEGVLSGFSLPEWEAFPALPLYMDQVIFLLNQYLAMLPEQAREGAVTPAMINNYVKLKIVPPPVKKRYGRAHLAYLIIVCVCKQTLTTGDIKHLIPLTLTEEEVRRVYAGFTEAFRDMQAYFCGEVRKAAAPVFRENGEPVTHLLFRTAAIANLTTLLTEQILRLDDGGQAGSGPA